MRLTVIIGGSLGDGLRGGGAPRLRPVERHSATAHGDRAALGPVPRLTGYDLSSLRMITSTAATIDADGWLHTGEFGVAGRQGWFTVVDRVKEEGAGRRHRSARTTRAYRDSAAEMKEEQPCVAL